MGRKNFWILLDHVACRHCIRGFMGQLANGISWLSWLNFWPVFWS